MLDNLTQLLPKEALLVGNSLMTVAYQTSLIGGALLGALLLENFASPAATMSLAWNNSLKRETRLI